MKQLLTTLLITLTAVLTLSAQTGTTQDLGDIDRERLANAMQMMDNGQVDKAIEIIRDLDKRFPDNYDVLYELGYAYNLKKDYDSLLKLCKRLKKHPQANFQIYQMLGNTLDYMGKRKDAIKAYQEGLKRFPNAGLLYVEQAIISEHEQDYDKAVALYEQAIEVEPGLATSYYHLAKIFAMSTEPVWAIIYGEAARLLYMGSQRSQEMSKLVYDMYKEHINIGNGGDSIHTTLTKENVINISADTSVVRIPLPISYEMATLKSMAPLHPTVIDLPTLSKIRQGVINHFKENLNGYYDVSILDFQRRVLDSGHWEAYNMWLMQEGEPEGFDKWSRQDSATTRFKAFARWYSENPFAPTQLCPTLRTRVFLDENLNISSASELGDAQGCRKHSADALRLARWLFEQPYDSTNLTIKRAQQYLIIWATNSDEVSLALQSSAVNGTAEGTVYTVFALIEYAPENKVKRPGEDGYVYAVKRTLDYLDRNRSRLPLSEKMEHYLQLPPDELDRQLHDDYKGMQ